MMEYSAKVLSNSRLWLAQGVDQGARREQSNVLTITGGQSRVIQLQETDLTLLYVYSPLGPINIVVSRDEEVIQQWSNTTLAMGVYPPPTNTPSSNLEITITSTSTVEGVNLFLRGGLL